MRYPVVIHKDKDSAYGVTVPDIPGCFSAGDTIDEAMENTREAIYAHLELVTGSGGDVADARSIEEYQANKAYAGGTWALVEVDVEDLLGPAERINVTIPKRILAKIDTAVSLLGATRSGFLTEAALKFINTDKGMSHTLFEAAMSKPVGSGGKRVAAVSARPVSQQFQRKPPKAGGKKPAAAANK